MCVSLKILIQPKKSQAFGFRDKLLDNYCYVRHEWKFHCCGFFDKNGI